MQPNKSLATLIAFAGMMALGSLVLVARSDGHPRAMAAVLAPVAAGQDNEKGDEPNPRLVVPNVDEPDVPIDGKASERPDFVAPIQGGGFIFERKDTDGKRVGGVVIPGIALVNRGLVELFGCGEGGK